jgi:hypothetical protein
MEGRVIGLQPKTSTSQSSELSHIRQTHLASSIHVGALLKQQLDNLKRSLPKACLVEGRNAGLYLEQYLVSLMELVSP